MPKQKTHSASKRRFRVTGTGKIVMQHANLRHNFESKPTRRTRRLSKDTILSTADSGRIKKLISS